MADNYKKMASLIIFPPPFLAGGADGKNAAIALVVYSSNAVQQPYITTCMGSCEVPIVITAYSSNPLLTQLAICYLSLCWFVPILILQFA